VWAEESAGCQVLQRVRRSAGGGSGSAEQRKTVTVLFCDVTESTALGEWLDPESFRQVMRRYFDAARAVIERHGGTVEKFIGDAVMARVRRAGAVRG
jgi:class 3 adenylate cyclase